MKSQEYITIAQLAKVLGITRIAVYKKVKKGQVPAEKIGKMYIIPKKYIDEILGKTLSESEKKEIDAAVKKTVSEYGEVLKLLGKE
ncbi:MAG: helix-turn-helix domain-containing protein [Candidatus Omnitrophota bacterium]|nr:helix-turn-helix domain-containing protein [Candidatus Omnitrophota bacterium]